MGKKRGAWQTLVTRGWESELRWVSRPLAPEPYLAPTLLSLYVFPLLDEKKIFF